MKNFCFESRLMQKFKERRKMGAFESTIYTRFGAKDKVSTVLNNITKKASACLVS